MNDIIFEALKLLIMVCVAVIARYVIPWLKSRIEQDKMAAIEKMVTQAVLYAQQVLTSKSGAEKKAIVTDLLKDAVWICSVRSTKKTACCATGHSRRGCCGANRNWKILHDDRLKCCSKRNVVGK